MSTQVMRALRFTSFGPPSVLRIDEVAIPEPGEGEVLVRVKAAAIEIVPFEKAVDAYGRVAAGQAKAKQVLSFD
jgi:D-arabinose 1-dehydrogenase-like Zn-dependent alcohol dehydrogenase